MKKNFVTIFFLVAVFCAGFAAEISAQNLGFRMTSTHNGSPLQRQFSFSPALKVRSGPFTFPMPSVFTILANGQQEITAHVGTPPDGLYFDKNRWYTIKVSGNPCFENVFKIYFKTAYAPSIAPALNWASSGASTGNGFMQVTNFVPTSIAASAGDNQYYSYFSDIVVRCLQP